MPAPSSQLFRLTNIAFVAILTLVSCDEAPTKDSAFQEKVVVDLSEAWIEAEPSAVGLNVDVINGAIVAARAIPRMKSLVIVKNGRLIVDHYQYGGASFVLYDVRSVTKSMVSTLAGLALEDGSIGDIDDPFTDYLSFDEDLDTAKSAITVRQMLSMSTGLYWDEFTSTSYSDWIASTDKTAFVLAQPMVNAPGTTFMYNSGTAHLLGLVVASATKMSIRDYAQQKIFGPLGIENVGWETMNDGSTNGGAGLKLRARDMARFGQLFLQGGVSGEQQVIPAAWVADATTAKFAWRSTFGAITQQSYAYLWWTNETAPNRAFIGWGYGGQFIYVVPNDNLVIVTTSDYAGVTDDIGVNALTQSILDVIINYVLAAVEA